MKANAAFEPKIIGFLCNWCSYAGADLAGVSRIQYPPNIRIIRVMCSGRIDPAFILKAFKDGADGVLVAGCHLPSDCHYISGNFKAERRIILLKKVLEELGIEPERLRLEWISASEGDRFAAVVRQMVNEVKELGPNPLTIKGKKSDDREAARNDKTI
jgi:F420-non-reducing hydrogenase iron-sulfur subunit